MSAIFLTDLTVKEVETDDSGLWELTTPLIYVSGKAGRIVVPARFVTDYASVPRFPLIYALVGNVAQKAAVVHDYLYRKGSQPNISRELADEIFREAAESQEVHAWRRWILWAGVRVGGWMSWKKKTVFNRGTL